jgi:hypothetical protein
LSQGLSIGVDFGSTGLRAAYVAEGRAPVGPDCPGGDAGPPWILCERHPEQRLGIAFPSLKSRLGLPGSSAIDCLPMAPAEAVTRALRALKLAVEDHASRAVSGAAVITVPALFAASQRAALRAAVLAAGFSEAHLLNDAVAAVIAHTAQHPDPATVLVYAMGYSGFETALVRAAHGHYRVLGYEGGASPAGRAFDQLLLESMLGVLEERRLRLDSAGWDAARWLQIRAATERAKEGLSALQQVAFPVSLETPDGRFLGHLSLGRAGFEEAIRPLCERTLQQTASLLEQAGMTAAQVDTVLLAGGSTRIPLLRALVAGALGREPVALDDRALAHGAALFAARLQSRPVAEGAEQERAGAASRELETPADLTALRAAIAVSEAPLPQASGDGLVLVVGGNPGGDSAARGQALLLPAERLIEQGRTHAARSLLEEVIRQAQARLAALAALAAPPASAASPPPAPPAPSAASSAGPAAPTSPAAPSPAAILARRALVRARQLLKKGQYEEAVRESHLAWQQDRDNPDVFEQMIDVHSQAAMASDGAEGYTDAQRWLMCAYSHDESNVRVRDLLAERHFLHARQLGEQGKRQQALESLEHCFSWNPEHQGARQLHLKLTRR